VLLRGHVDDAMVPEFHKQGGDSFVRMSGSQGDGTEQKPRGGNQARAGRARKARSARIEIVERGWEEPAGNSSEEKRRVEVQRFTVE
jgi:NitT/TauT family transport system substrate-binding protein